MRTYIFTPRERAIIHSMLKGGTPIEFRKLKYRIKSFNRLADDFFGVLESLLVVRK